MTRLEICWPRRRLTELLNYGIKLFLYYLNIFIFILFDTARFLTDNIYESDRVTSTLPLYVYFLIEFAQVLKLLKKDFNLDRKKYARARPTKAMGRDGATERLFL